MAGATSEDCFLRMHNKIYDVFELELQLNLVTQSSCIYRHMPVMRLSDTTARDCNMCVCVQCTQEQVRLS